MKKIKKIIALILGVLSLSTLYTVKANAAWVKDSYGWWNTEGNSWSIGWKLIDGEWYYFDSQGYMKTGWVIDNGKWYYLNSDGTMAKNTVIDNYTIGSDGVWIEEKNTEITTDNTQSDSTSLTITSFLNELKNTGYSPEIKNAEKGFLKGEKKIISIGNENLEVYTYASNEEMEKDAANIFYGGFSYENEIGTCIDLSWNSYPYFYKNKNMIVLYVGKNEKIISDLNNILGHHFMGIEPSASLSNMDDVRKIVLDNFYKNSKNTFRCPWQKAKILDSNENSSVEENEYLIYFLGEYNDLKGVTVDKDTLEPTSFWDID